MSEIIRAHPLTWPAGWKRSPSGSRTVARFLKDGKYLTVGEGVRRVRDELRRMGVVEDDVVISTNVATRLDGLPRSDQPKPADPGAAVYWRESSGTRRCMAIDRYTDLPDNLAAIAATLDAMRAIERHGGAMILERAFTGFTALPGPDTVRPWHEVLGIAAHSPTDEVRATYRRLRSSNHPDRGGSAAAFAAVEAAWSAFQTERGLTT